MPCHDGRGDRDPAQLEREAELNNRQGHKPERADPPVGSDEPADEAADIVPLDDLNAADDK